MVPGGTPFRTPQGQEYKGSLSFTVSKQKAKQIDSDNYKFAMRIVNAKADACNVQDLEQGYEAHQQTKKMISTQNGQWERDRIFDVFKRKGSGLPSVVAGLPPIKAKKTSIDYLP